MSSSTKTSVLFTGATGFIGGSILSRLLGHPEFSKFEYTAIVRSQEKADKLTKFGVKAVVGSHSDSSVITPLAAKSDIVIATANCDDLEAAKATLAGLKQRFEATGVPPVFIHTSGAGAFLDKSDGDSTSDVIYDDTNADQIEALPETQVHRNVDLEVVGADKEGYLKSYIVYPSVVCDVADGSLVDAGIQNPHSIVIPLFAKISFERGVAATIGKGANIWPIASIRDTADLYIALLSAILKTPEEVGHGREGYFIGENGEVSAAEISRAIGQAMVTLGRAADPEPTPLTEEELQKYFGGSKFLGGNMRCVGKRARALGWTPKDGKEEIISSIQPEINVLLTKSLLA